MSASAKYFHPEMLSRVARLELRARHVVEGFLAGRQKSPYKGFSVEFAGHRAYVPGDDIRRIDWRVYGKADRYFIKEHEEETNLRTWILLDCSGSMGYPQHPGTGRMTKWDYAATLAASLAHLLVYQRDAVGLTLFDDAIRAQLPLSSRRASLAALSATIESHAPRGGTAIKALFSALTARLPRRGLVILVSDLLTDVDELVRGLSQLRFRHHDVIVLHVLDEDELRFPFESRTLFEGIEQTNLEVLTDPQSLRASYLAALESFLARVRRACVDHRIDYELISTVERFDVALTRFLARRMHGAHART